MNEPDWGKLAPGWDPSTRTETADTESSQALEDIEKTARQVAGGGIRAAVLGVNDGLVTNLCLTLGVAGAATGAGTVRLSGLASLVAGALSMAAGEWVSVRSQVDVAQGIERDLHRAWHLSPPLVLSRLAGAMQRYGLDTQTAKRASEGVISYRPTASKTAARILFGVNSDDAGSPIVAAVTSLILFMIGAFIPLAPWFFTAGGPAVIWSVSLTAVASLFVGGYLGVSSGRSPWWGAGRQLLIVAVASAVTYYVGDIFGTAVA